MKNKTTFLQRMGFSVIAVLLGMCVSTAAAEPVSIAIDKQRVILGDSCVFTITVTEGEITPPTIPSSPDLTVTYEGVQQESFSSFQLIVNGRQVQAKRSGGTKQYTYRVVPKKLGTVMFPSFEIEHAGKTHKTNPFSIEVVDETQQSDALFVVQSVDKQTAYLGEKITYTFKWYFNSDIQGYECSIPWLNSLKDFIIQDPDLDKNKEYQRFVVNGSQEMYADKTTEVYNGKQYAVVTFKKILVPLAAGEYDLDGAFLRCDVVTGYDRRRGSFFDDFFGNNFNTFFGVGHNAVTEPSATRSKPIHITVTDIPKDSAPGDFTNGIGNFAFTVVLSKQQVKTGDPITVAMKILGEGNLEQLNMPPFPDLDGWKCYEPESKIVSGTLNGKPVKMKTFEKVIIPTVSGTATIPAISFTFFNPATKQYKTITRGPFTITVEKGDKPEEEIRLLTVASSGSDQQKEIKIITRDIQFIKTALGPVTYQYVPSYKRRVLVMLLLCGPAMLTLCLAFVITRRLRLVTDTAYARVQRAGKQALRELQQCVKSITVNDKDFYFSVIKVLNNYLSAKLQVPAGGITPDIADELTKRTVPQNLVTLVRELYALTDHIKFSFDTQAVSDVAYKQQVLKNVREVIVALEKEL